MAYQVEINGETRELDVPGEMPLLWALRNELGMVGTKFGCGMALCGACTVHLDGVPVRSCQTPVSAVAGKKVSTIESLSANNSHPLQKAWIAHDVPQCGYCQSGQLMSAAALLEKNKNPSDADIDAAMSGNICRCGTYQRIRAAIKDAAGLTAAPMVAAPAAAKPLASNDVDDEIAAASGSTGRGAGQ